MDAAGDEAVAGALGAAAHGLVERLGHAVPVVQRQAPVEHELDRAAGQAGAALRAVRHHRQRAPPPLLPPAEGCFESVEKGSRPLKQSLSIPTRSVTTASSTNLLPGPTRKGNR